MTSYITLKARVYYITKNENSYNIHAYVEYNGKRIKFFTLQTEKEIPEIIFEKYRKIKKEDKYYYPKVFIVPTPSMRTNKSIHFDDKFNLVVVYAKEIPSRIPLDKLIRVYKMRIYEKNGKLKNMYVEGFCRLDALDTLINNNNLELRSYNINLIRANIEDLLRFFSYNFRYNSRNKQNNKDEEMKKIGPYIFIGKDRDLSCKQSYITPRDIKILEIYK